MTGRLLIMFLILSLLTSVTFSVSSSLSLPLSLSVPPNTHRHTVAHMNTLFCRSAESPLPKHLCHLSPSSLKLFAVALFLPQRRRGNERNEMGKKGQGRQSGQFIHSRRLICSERRCFGSKNFPLTRVQLIL